MSKKDIKTNLAKLEKSKFYKYEITSYSDINNINFALSAGIEEELKDSHLRTKKERKN